MLAQRKVIVRPMPVPQRPASVLHITPAKPAAVKRPYTLPKREDIPDGKVLDAIVRHAREVLHVSEESLKSVRRHPNITACRMVIAKVARRITHASFVEITVFMGRTNHSTTISCLDACERILAEPNDSPRRVLFVCGSPMDLQEAIDKVAARVRAEMKGVV